MAEIEPTLPPLAIEPLLKVPASETLHLNVAIADVRSTVPTELAVKGPGVPTLIAADDVPAANASTVVQPMTAANMRNAVRMDFASMN
jgi:hypothetical protein